MKTKMEISSLNIGIIGLGQLGASIAAGLKGKVKSIIGFDVNSEHIDICISSKIIDYAANQEDMALHSDIIIVATPVNHIVRIVKNLLNFRKKELIVFDVGSTKNQICRELSEYPNRVQFVATHPMAGNTGQGPRSASKNLFLDKPVYICNEHESDSRAINTVCKIWNTLGATIKFTTSEEHDRIVALNSHLPQLLSYAMVNSIASPELYYDSFSSASSGFDSVTRLAKSSSSMWIPIVNHNRQNILYAINEMQHQLKQIETAIKNDDVALLKALFENANQVRKIFEEINQKTKTKSHETQRL